MVIVVVVLVAGAVGGSIWWRQRVPAQAPAVVAETPVVTPQPAPPPEPPKERKETVTLKRGDTLIKALAAAGLEARTAAEIAFLGLGPVAETFLRAAAAAGTLRLEHELRRDR